MNNKQIVEDFLHFLNTKSGVINTDNYTYSYQELRNALIEYHKETAAAAFQSPVISDPDVVSKIKEQMAICPDEDVENAKQKLIENFSKMEKHPSFMFHLDKNTEDDIPVITKEQIEEFKEELTPYTRRSPEETKSIMEELSARMAGSLAFCPQCNQEVYYQADWEGVWENTPKDMIHYKEFYGICPRCDNIIHVPQLEETNKRIRNKALEDKK